MARDEDVDRGVRAGVGTGSLRYGDGVVRDIGLKPCPVTRSLVLALLFHLGLVLAVVDWVEIRECERGVGVGVGDGDVWLNLGVDVDVDVDVALKDDGTRGIDDFRGVWPREDAG